jgi:hypothetical protein
MTPAGAPQSGSGWSGSKTDGGPDAQHGRGVAGRGRALRAAFGWAVVLGSVVLLVAGVVNGIRAVVANGYLSQGLPNAAVYTFQSAPNQYVRVIAGLVAVLFLAAPSSPRPRYGDRNRLRMRPCGSRRSLLQTPQSLLMNSAQRTGWQPHARCSRIPDNPSILARVLVGIGSSRRRTRAQY